MKPSVSRAERSPDFLAGGGELGERIRAFDWSNHPLGIPDQWPQSLKTSVSLILNSQHPMWIGWGPQISFLYNDAYVHVLGKAKHEWALGRPVSEVWAEIWDTIGPLVEKVFRKGEATFIDDMRLFMSRGDFIEETYYSYSYSPIRDESGQVGGLFCPSTDVSPKIIGARRLRTLSELSSSGLVEKTVESASATAVATLGRNPDDIPFALLYLAENGRAELRETVGLTKVDTLLAPPSLELGAGANSIVWPLAEVFASGKSETIRVSELSGLPKGLAGQTVGEALVLPVVSPTDGTTMGVLIAGVSPARRLDRDYRAFFDLVASSVGTALQNARAAEEEKRRHEALAELDRAKTAFFSNVSHEFRTPLTLMLGPIETLLSQEGLPADQRDQLDAAHRNSLRLLKLVNSLLDFSRIEAGRIKASYAPADLAEFTKDLASTFRSAIETAGLEYVVDCRSLPEPVYVDRDMWEKIVLNLLSNAFKFTLAGRITICLEPKDGTAVLTVSDTGTGIPRAELAHIFERFHRVEGTQGRTFEGTGIGLALIQELVRLHGGSIQAESELGEGSVFTIRLPYGREHLPPEHVVETAGAGQAIIRADAYTSEALSWVARKQPIRIDEAKESSLATSTESRPRILLVDDSADMREHIMRILGDTYELVTASDGQAALVEAKRSRPDLVLSDVMMPGLNGFELLAELRSDPDMVNVPFILLSARAGEEARSEGMQAGADDYLIKPFSARELVARVTAHLKLSRFRQEANDRERAAHDEAEALNEVSRVLGSELDLQKLVQTVTDVATKLTNAKFGAFFYNVFNESGESYMLYTLSGASREEFEKFGMMPRNTPVFRTTFSGEGPRRSDDIRQDPDYGKMSPHFGMPKGHLPVRSYLAVPVKSRSGDVLGGLFFGHPEAGIFTDASERLATGIASHAAIAIDNANLYQQAEQQARSSMLLASIVDSSDDAIISKDLDGVITSWNNSAERLFGYVAEEAIGKTVAELLIPRDRQEEEQNILARLRSGERVDHFETIRQRKDGTFLNVALTISPIRDAQGRIVGASKTARDITQQIKAREAIENLNVQLASELDATNRLQELGFRLMENENFVGLMDETIEAALKVTSADMGNIQLVEGENLRIIAQRGFDSDFLNFFDQLEVPHSACRTCKDIRQRVIVEDVAHHPAFAGTSSLPVMLPAQAQAVQSTPLITRGGELIGILSTHYRTCRRPSDRDLRFLDILARQTADIIERHRAERALRTSEERLRLAQKAAKIGTFEWDIQSGVNTWSTDLEELYGLKPGSFGATQEDWERLVHPEDRQAAKEKVSEAIKTGMPVEGEWRVVWPDGSVHWLAGRFQAHGHANGVALRMRGVHFEITERKRIENELRSANRDLEQFAYSASHDLQEPLRSVSIFSELLSKRYGAKLDPDALDLLVSVRASASRMEMLLRDLLSYTQASTAEKASELTQADEALQRALANLTASITESGATIETQPLPAVRIHAVQLTQIFQNLISNALKYHQSGVTPTVRVSARLGNGYWVFSITDNGIGIEPEYREKVFGLFKRLHTGDEYSGTGIGLALCQRIVERHDGRIWVESEPGKGSTFFFTLPQ